MMFCNLQWHLVWLNFMTCGLEICIAAGIAYVPPLLLEAGVEEQYMTMVLGIGPVLGLIFVPLIGSASDNCQSTLGRRRPFIWLLSIGVLLSLFIIPHADSLASFFSNWGKNAHILILIFGVGLLDCCVQVCFTPLEALLSDLCHDDEGCDQAFAMFSFMISFGGCIGYLLAAVNWNYTYMAIYLGFQDECLFLLLTVIFIISFLVTMKTSEEPIYSSQQTMKPTSTSGLLPRDCCTPKRKLRWKCNPLFCLLSLCWSVYPKVYSSYCRIPSVMKQLCASQLCSWMAVMSFMLFYTEFVAEGLYNGIPSAAPGTESRLHYDEGIRMGSVGLFLQCASMVTFTSSALVICLSQNILIVTIMSSLTGFAENRVFMPRAMLSQSKNGYTLAKEAVYFSSNNNEDGTFKHNGTPQGKEEHIYIPCEMETSTQDYPYPSNLILPAIQKETYQDNYTQRGIGLDFATLDSAFLLSQVFPTLFMGMMVQFMENVMVYIASSVLFGVFAIYLASHVVFDQKDLKL